MAPTWLQKVMIDLRAPLLPIFFALLSACGVAPKRPASTTALTAASAPVPSPLVTVNGLLARESSAPLLPFSVRALDGAFTAEVLAASAPALESKLDEGGAPFAVLSIPIGGAEPMVCVVTNAMRDAGAFVSATLAAAKQRNAFTGMAVPSLRVSVVGDAPLVEAVSGTLQGKTVYEAKFAMLSRPGGSVLCVHDNVGYHATFARVVASLTSTVRHRGWTEARFREVSVMREGERVAGVTQRYGYTGERGERREATYTTVFRGLRAQPSPEEAGGWAAIDYAEIAELNAKGELSSATTAIAFDGKLVGRTAVKRARGNQYTYEGERFGRPLPTGTLKTARPLRTELSRASSMRQFIDGTAKGMHYSRLDEQEDSVRVVDVRVERLSGRKAAVIEEQKRSVCEIGDDGLCAREEVTEPGRPSRMWERLQAEGQL
jgi:hypothetical protein